MKLAVGYPWYSPFIWTATTDSLLSLKHPLGVQVKFFRGGGWSPARRHTHICEQALEWGADLICIVGSDQVYDEDLLERLIARHQEGYEVVSALVPCRGYFHWQDMRPFQPMAWRFRKSNQIDPIREFEGQSGDMIEYIRPEDGEMQRINFIGSGVFMFHRDHLAMMKRPWFFEKVDPETQNRTASMDTTFCWRLQSEAHATVWVDTTIKVKHLHTFEVDETFQNRFADWADGGGDPNVCLYPKEAAE